MMIGLDVLDLETQLMEGKKYSDQWVVKVKLIILCTCRHYQANVYECLKFKN